MSSSATDVSNKSVLIELFVYATILHLMYNHPVQCNAPNNKTYPFLTTSLLKEQNSVSGHSSPGAAFYTPMVHNIFPTHLHCHSDDREKFATYLGRHSVAQHRSHILSPTVPCQENINAINLARGQAYFYTHLIYEVENKGWECATLTSATSRDEHW